MIGQTIGLWTVVGLAGRTQISKNQLYVFRCACGAETLKSKNVMHTSYGCRSCYWKRKVEHNLSGTGVYHFWYKLRRRFRAGKVLFDPRWLEIKHFYNDMGDKPKDHKLVLRNRALGYNKENCFWGSAPMKKRRARKAKYEMD